ncbi:MAG: hypothetical protein ACREBE_02715 [bacterium]
MKSGDLDKRLGALLDGALEGVKRERLEREIERDPALQTQLRRAQSLGSLVREAWCEGPAAPAPEFLISSLRPQIAAIARERRARPSWQRGLERIQLQLSNWFGPLPIAASAAAAFLVAVALLPRIDGTTPALTAGPIFVVPPATGMTTAHHGSDYFAPVGFAQPERYFSTDDAAAGVYDVAPGENPAMLFQNEDGSTSLWLLGDDDLSLRMQRSDRWG